MVAMRMVAVVADSHAHMMLDRIRHNHCDTKPQDSVGETQGIDVTVAQEQHAGSDAPYQVTGVSTGLGRWARENRPAAATTAATLPGSNRMQAKQEVDLQPKTAA